MRRAGAALVAVCFMIALLVGVHVFVLQPAVRNVASLAYLKFAVNLGVEKLPRLAQSAAGYARYATARGEGGAQRRAEQIEDRWQRYSAHTSNAIANTNSELRVPCTVDQVTVQFSVDANAAEWTRDIDLALTWLGTPDDDAAGAQQLCETSLPKTVAVENLAWRGEDLAILPGDDLPGYGSGTRTQELRAKTSNRLQTIARNGRSATVFSLENLVDVDNVIMSHPIPVAGGAYLLGGWIKTSNQAVEAWLGLVCIDPASATGEKYYYVARRLTSLNWTHASALIALENAQKCRILMLNYGEPGIAYFDELVLAQLPKEYAPNASRSD